MKKSPLKIFIALAIALTILWFTNNFAYGAYLDGTARELYASYANDILLPFGFYFGLCALEFFIPSLSSWKVKASISFLLPAILEFLQPLWQKGMGLDFSTAEHLGLGISFDLLDFFAYALGILFATVIDRQVFTRLSFWNGYELAH